MQTLSLLFTGACLSQLLLAVFKLWYRRKPKQAELLYGLLNLSLAVYFLDNVVALPGYFVAPVVTAIPGLFWLSCGAIFEEQFRLGKNKLMLLAATIVFPQLYQILSVFIEAPNVLRVLLVDTSQLLEFILVLWALYLVARSFAADLVLARRELRIWVFGLAGLIIFVRIFEQQLVRLESEWFELGLLMGSALLLLILNIFFLRWDNNVFVRFVSTSKPAEPDPLLQKLEDLMSHEYHYRSHGLTIGHLASTLSVSPTKLRALINGRLAHRNFNSFLNQYRIDEASLRLAREDTPVLNIALDVGFKSLSSFNQAFKAIHGKTPTQYRDQ